MRKIVYYIFFITFAVNLTACRHKKVLPKEPVVVVDTTNERCRMDFKNGKALGKRMNESELTYVYANAKFNCELKMDSEEHSFNVSVRTRKDSVIWMSISKLGIEAARVLITKDSVKFTLGLTEKKFFTGDFSYINQMMHADLDFNMLQALLFGNSAEFYDDDEKLKPGRDKSSCQYFLSTVRKRHVKRIVNGTEQPKEAVQTIWLDPQTFKIVTTEFNDVETKRKFNATYEDFKPVENYLAPFKMFYKITAEKNITADIKYARISINEPQTFPFKISPNYDRIDFKK